MARNVGRHLLLAFAFAAFPHYSPFFKSTDLGQTFRIPGPRAELRPDLRHGWRRGRQLPGRRDLGRRQHRLRSEPGRDVYISFINFTDAEFPTLALARSTHDGAVGSFVTDSVCNTLNSKVPTSTTCPDPLDSALAGRRPARRGLLQHARDLHPVRARATPIIPGVSAGPPYSLWIAKSTDGGSTWTRSQVADLGAHNPQNLFPELAIDKAGNLYYTWSQTEGRRRTRAASSASRTSTTPTRPIAERRGWRRFRSRRSRTTRTRRGHVRRARCGQLGVPGGWTSWGRPRNPEGYGESFYIGYRDNPPNGAPGGEAGMINNVNPTITSLEYNPTRPATVGVTCFATAPPSPCTVVLTTSAGGLGIKSGAGMYSITGLSTFFGGNDQQTPVALRLEEGNSEQPDATAPFDVNGTGTTG